MTIKKTIAIASAKGGVGKSTVCSFLASALSKENKVGILDADIYGCLLYTSPSPRDLSSSRMPSSA